MVIALAGHKGFVGKHIKDEFEDDDFILLERSDLYDKPENIAKKIQGASLVINAAGFPVAVRWSQKNRRAIYDSRIYVTRNLVTAINMLEDKPVCLVNTSAIGIYAQNREHTEKVFAYQNDFLSDVVNKWELEAEKVSGDVRLIKMRLGMVLGNDGGALPRLLTLFRFGLGGIIASGKQVYSFIHIGDVTAAIRFLIDSGGEGAYNFTTPMPVTNREFTHTISRTLKRPALIRVPGIVLKLLMGEAAVIVTGGQTVYPKKLQDEGYNFTFVSIDDAIENLVNRE
ncbi:MAG: TIGR01777 family oxidoreductase [Bacteroidales bacterium]|nr:TIGR01777 family oxidoreductase [Bacteroidales bacterium]